MVRQSNVLCSLEKKTAGVLVHDDPVQDMISLARWPVSACMTGVRTCVRARALRIVFMDKIPGFINSFIIIIIIILKQVLEILPPPKKKKKKRRRYFV